MVGLITAVAAPDPDESGAGFAVPVDDVFRRAVQALSEGRAPEFGFLGISPRNLTPQQIAAGRWGVQVGEVVVGTPADGSGLVFGDIITHVEQEPVRDARQLMREVSRRAPGDTIHLRYVRQAFGNAAGQRGEAAVVLSKKASVSSRPVFSQLQAPRWRGLTVDYATAFPGFQTKSRLIDRQGCVAILDVQVDSPAWQAGLRAQTFVSHVEGHRVARPAEFYARAAQYSGPVQVTLTTEKENRPTHVVVPEPATDR
jgi:serine protease Do